MIPGEIYLGKPVDARPDEVVEQFPDHRVGLCPHDYDVVVIDSAIVRWCTNCGKTWMLQKRVPGESFPTEWERVWENG